MNIKLIHLKTLPNIEHILEMNNIYLSFVLTKHFFNAVYVIVATCTIYYTTIYLFCNENLLRKRFNNSKAFPYK